MFSLNSLHFFIITAYTSPQCIFHLHIYVTCIFTTFNYCQYYTSITQCYTSEVGCIFVLSII